MENEIKRLDKKTLYRQVGEELREYIIQNNLKENDRLPTEMELAKRLGVSRSSVREGIRYLETMGFIETYFKSGIKVKSSNLDPFADVIRFQYRRMRISTQELYEARLMLELDALELAVPRIGAQQIQTMEESIRRSEEKNRRDEDISKEDLIFHNTLFLASGNKVIEQFNGVLAEVFREESRMFQRAKTDKSIFVDDRIPIGEHKKILAAVKARDMQAATDEMRRHLSKFKREQLS